MDQERVTLMPRGGIKRTARSIENLGDTRGMVSKNGTIHFQKWNDTTQNWNDTLPKGTIQDKIGTIQTNTVEKGKVGGVLS